MLCCDVVVVGAGPAGVAAAVAAPRKGAKALLVERHPFAGGMGTAALVNNFCPAHLDDERLIIGGIFAEVRNRLIQRRAIYASLDHATRRMEVYDPGVYAEELAALCREAGVELLTGQQFQSADFSNGTGVLEFSSVRVAAKVVVDATGNADVAAAAGVSFRMGRPSDGAVMPLTFCFRLGPIDLEKLGREMPECLKTDALTGERYCDLGWHPVINARLAEARGRGELTIPTDRIPALTSIPGCPEEATANFGRVECKDPTDPVLLARAEEQGRRQIAEAIVFCQKHIPGFEKVELLEVARQIGVRQSRQIEGLYTITGEDCVACRQFDDVIAQCCYSIDIHEPGSDTFTLIKFEKGKHYDIPWRCLVPKSGPSNIVVAGRCISATTEAMGSFRVAPSVMAIGEAAGVTAALAVERHCTVREVDPRLVQECLRKDGGILD